MTYCTRPTVTSNDSFASRRSEIASPSAVTTSGSFVLRPFGVCTASEASNGCAQYGANPEYVYAVLCDDDAKWSQNRRNNTAPRELTFSLRSQDASTEHALPTATGAPDDVG